MMKRVVILPEQLDTVLQEIKGVKQLLKADQRHVEDPILDTEGVMTLLKVSRRLLQNWRDEGMIEFSAVGGKFYYRASAIDKMLNRHLQKTEAA
jgi:hypothetical protein